MKARSSGVVYISDTGLEDELDATEAIGVHVTVRTRDRIARVVVRATEVDVKRSLTRPVVELVTTVSGRSEVAVAWIDVEDKVLAFEREGYATAHVELQTDTNQRRRSAFPCSS